VNLIPYNKVEGLAWRRPSDARQEQFAAVLAKRAVSFTLRARRDTTSTPPADSCGSKTEQRRGEPAAP